MLLNHNVRVVMKDDGFTELEVNSQMKTYCEETVKNIFFFKSNTKRA